LARASTGSPILGRRNLINILFQDRRSVNDLGGDGPLRPCAARPQICYRRDCPGVLLLHQSKKDTFSEDGSAHVAEQPVGQRDVIDCTPVETEQLGAGGVDSDGIERGQDPVNGWIAMRSPEMSFRHPDGSVDNCQIGFPIPVELNDISMQFAVVGPVQARFSIRASVMSHLYC